MAGVGQEVYVKLVSGQTVTLEAHPSDTVRTLAAQVASRAGLTQVRLKYQGKVLKPQHTVGYLGIRVETILKAEEVVVKTLSLSVRVTEQGEEISTTGIHVANLSPLSDVTARLQDKGVLLPSGKTILKLGTRVLNKLDETFLEAEIPDGATLELVVQKALTTNKEGTTALAAEDDYSDADLAVMLDTFDAGSRPVDVIFSFDTTGSMYSCLDRVRQRLREACTRLLGDIPRLRIGIMAHGDYCDNSTYVLRYIDLTREVNNLTDFVKDVPATSGGDSPECYEWVLRKAQLLDWAEDSAKALVVIGDDTPHAVSYTDQRINWQQELDVLRGMGVKVYGVQAGNVTDAASFYQHIAEHTGGAYIKFNNFQAITDMFLAVCYREADGGGEAEGGQLAAFMEELQEEGRLEGDVNDVIQQVAQEAAVEPPVRRYIAQGWWDATLDMGQRPQYKYDVDTDTWSLNQATLPSSPEPSPCWRAASPIRASMRSTKKTKKCTIM